MLYLPTLHLHDGHLVRRAGFPTADDAFRGTPGDTARFFAEKAGLNILHVLLADGDDPLSDATRGALADILASGAVLVLLEGTIADTATCEKLASLRVRPVVTPAIARDPRYTLDWNDALPHPVYVATDAEYDALADQLEELMDAGLPPLLYRPRDPQRACDVYHHLHSSLPEVAMPFIAVGPSVTPDLDSIEQMMSFSRRIYRHGLPAIAVDAEWFVDYHLT